MSAPDPNEPALEVTHESIVTEDQIDELGHMNVRFYGRNAMAATTAFCDAHDIAVQAITSVYTRHHHEQMLGSRLVVSSGALRSRSGFRLFHELRNGDGVLGATFVHEFDHASPDTPVIELPDYGAPRSLRLDVDAVGRAPTLQTLLDLELAVRLPREVTTSDTLGTDVVPVSEANMLIWGGEAPAGARDFVRIGPNGERVGMAVMESRGWVGAMPTIGTHIQSFGATMEVREKVARSRSWCIDLDTGQVVAAFESVNLAFDLDERRSMAIPPTERIRLESRLHPDFDGT